MENEIAIEAIAFQGTCPHCEFEIRFARFSNDFRIVCPMCDAVYKGFLTIPVGLSFKTNDLN